MPSINQQIYNRTIGASADLLRYEAAERAAIRSFLEPLRRSLVAEIADNMGTEFTQARLQSTLSAANAAIASTYRDIRAEQTVKMVELATVQQAVAEGIINNSIGAVLIDTTFSGTQLKSMMSNMLIEGAPSAEWWARAEKGVRERFADTVRQGMLRGDTTDAMVRAVKQDIIPRSTREAEAIVRTSVQTASNMVRLDVYQANSDLFDGIEWVSTLDDRTTEECQALDGCQWDNELNPIDDAPPFPGATAHWGCRSTQVPILKSWSQLTKEAGGDSKVAKALDEAEAENPGTRAAMDGEVPATQTYEDWLKDQSEEMQKDILGPGKWELWDGGNGNLSLREMVDQSGNPLTLAELEARAATSETIVPQLSDATREYAYELLGKGTRIEDVIDQLKAKFPNESNYRGMALQYRKDFKLLKSSPPAPVPKTVAPVVTKPTSTAYNLLPKEKIRGWADVEAKLASYERQGLKVGAENIRGYVDNVIAQADKMGFPRERIVFTSKPYTFELGNMQSQAAAWAEIDTTGDTYFYLGDYKPAYANPTAAHEFQHVMFQRVLDGYYEEERRIIAWANEPGHAIKDIQLFGAEAKSGHALREEFREQFPIFDRLNGYIRDIPKMERDDGVTRYSRAWWEEYSAGKTNFQIAYHETLAEIAAQENATVEYNALRGATQPAPIWQQFYADVNKFYEEIPALRNPNGYRAANVPSLITSDAKKTELLQSWLNAEYNISGIDPKVEEALNSLAKYKGEAYRAMELSPKQLDEQFPLHGYARFTRSYSATKDLSFAENWAETSMEGAAGKTKVILRIEGEGLADFESWSGYHNTEYANQREVVLRQGMRYVTKEITEEDGITYITIRIFP